MRLGRWEALKRGDVVAHEDSPGTLGVVVATMIENYECLVFVLWEDGQRERYAPHDAPKLWPW